MSRKQWKTFLKEFPSTTESWKIVWIKYLLKAIYDHWQLFFKQSGTNVLLKYPHYDLILKTSWFWLYFFKLLFLIFLVHRILFNLKRCEIFSSDFRRLTRNFTIIKPKRGTKCIILHIFIKKRYNFFWNIQQQN